MVKNSPEKQPFIDVLRSTVSVCAEDGVGCATTHSLNSVSPLDYSDNVHSRSGS